jgi:uncharacterized membrane-anchored protein
MAEGSRTEHINKVPLVTAAFWIIKILSTTVGETGADYLAVHVGLGMLTTTALTLSCLIVALVLQLRARQLIEWRYWLTVVLLSVVGTQVTDVLTDVLEVSLYWSTLAFGVILGATFAVWYWSERTLSIQAIDTRPRELFYWAAILVTFTLGTAAGDLATEALGLGFTAGTIVFGALLATCAAAYALGANSVLVFWIVYILTRPLGASLGDLLSQPRQNGGVGFGTTSTSLTFLTVIALLVAYCSRSNAQRRDPAFQQQRR